MTHHLRNSSDTEEAPIISTLSILIVAVIAILIVIAFRPWRYNRRRIHTAQRPTISASGSATTTTTSASGSATTTTTSASGSATQTVTEFVRGKSYRGSKVSVDLAALFGSSSYNTTLELSDSGGRFLGSLLELKCEVFVYCQVQDTEREAVLALLRPFGLRGLSRDRILFCKTLKAHESFTRQLVPTLLVSTHIETANAVARFIPYVVIVSSSVQSSAGAPNILTTHTLSALETTA